MACMSETPGISLSPRTLRVIGGVVLAAIALGGFLTSRALFPGVPFGEREFDAAAWRAGNTDTRARMAYALRERLLADRPPRTEIEALLGEPDREVADKRGIAYALGSWTGIDTDWLTIRFDDTGRVAHITIANY